MIVQNFEEGHSQLSAFARSPECGQFLKAAVILESTVKFYSASVDSLHSEVLDYNATILKGVYSRSLFTSSNPSITLFAFGHFRCFY